MYIKEVEINDKEQGLRNSKGRLTRILFACRV